jgi:DNA-binding MarR family transcriptional regulator
MRTGRLKNRRVTVTKLDRLLFRRFGWRCSPLHAPVLRAVVNGVNTSDGLMEKLGISKSSSYQITDQLIEAKYIRRERTGPRLTSRLFFVPTEAALELVAKANAEVKP